MNTEYTTYFVTKVVICEACLGSSINIKYHEVDLQSPYPDDFDCPACNGKGSIESKQIILTGEEFIKKMDDVIAENERRIAASDGAGEECE